MFALDVQSSAAQWAVAGQELLVPLPQQPHGAHFHCALPVLKVLAGQELLNALFQWLYDPHFALSAHPFARCARI